MSRTMSEILDDGSAEWTELYMLSAAKSSTAPDGTEVLDAMSPIMRTLEECEAAHQQLADPASARICKIPHPAELVEETLAANNAAYPAYAIDRDRRAELAQAVNA